MQLSPEAQRQEKHSRLEQTLRRFEVSLDPLEASPQSWGYRRRTRFAFSGQPGALLLGAWRAGSHEVVDLQGCPVADPVLLRVRDALREVLNARHLAPYQEECHAGILRHLHLQGHPQRAQVLATLVVRTDAGEDWEQLGGLLLRAGGSAGLVGVALNIHPSAGNALLGSHTRHLAGERGLLLPVGDLELWYPAGAFSQVNLEVAGSLYQQATRWALEDLPLEPGEGALDLFCGVGGLALHLASTGALPWGVGVELSSSAISAAELSARRLGVTGWTFCAGDTPSVLSELELPGAVAVAVVNPPRRGLGTESLASLVARRPRRILYVSCNPESLAHDVQRLTLAGYRLHRAKGFDMFPQTHHLETLAWLERVADPALA